MLFFIIDFIQFNCHMFLFHVKFRYFYVVAKLLYNSHCFYSVSPFVMIVECQN